MRLAWRRGMEHVVQHGAALVHLTWDVVDTVCGGHAGYIEHRILVKAPRRKRGKTNLCRVCFHGKDHRQRWDDRCSDKEGV